MRRNLMATASVLPRPGPKPEPTISFDNLWWLGPYRMWDGTLVVSPSLYDMLLKGGHSVEGIRIASQIPL